MLIRLDIHAGGCHALGCIVYSDLWCGIDVEFSPVGAAVTSLVMNRDVRQVLLRIFVLW
jgi:hypothetical protein